MNFNVCEYTRVHSYMRMTASNLFLCVCGNWHMNHAVECSVVAYECVYVCVLVWIRSRCRSVCAPANISISEYIRMCEYVKTCEPLLVCMCKRVHVVHFELKQAKPAENPVPLLCIQCKIIIENANQRLNICISALLLIWFCIHIRILLNRSFFKI